MGADDEDEETEVVTPDPKDYANALIITGNVSSVHTLVLSTQDNGTSPVVVPPPATSNHILEKAGHGSHLQTVPRQTDRELKSEELKQQFEGTTVFLGVDDMDNGINLKLLAFEHMLKEHPIWQGRAVLVQIANPARAKRIYLDEIQVEIEESCNTISKEFGVPGYEPIVFIRRSLSISERMAYCSTAERVVVTAVSDGMKLTPYEYIISRPGITGAETGSNSSTPKRSMLVVSEFIGCSPSLSGAIRGNPWYVESMAEAPNESISMSESDKGDRIFDPGAFDEVEIIHVTYSVIKSGESLFDLNNYRHILRKISIIKCTGNNSFSSVGVSHCVVVELDEAGEAARCLVRVSRRVGSFLKFNSSTEDSDDSSHIGGAASCGSKIYCGNDGDFAANASFVEKNVYGFGELDVNFEDAERIKAGNRMKVNLHLVGGDEWLEKCCSRAPIELLKFFEVQSYVLVGVIVMSTLGGNSAEGKYIHSIRLMDADVSIFLGFICRHLNMEALKNGFDAAVTMGTESTGVASHNVWIAPINVCEVYQTCEPCQCWSSRHSPMCHCAEWGTDNTCDKSSKDRFSKSPNVQVSTSIGVTLGVIAEYDSLCLSNCSDIAYSRDPCIRCIGCRSWGDNLMYFLRYSSGGPTHSVRLAYSVLEEQIDFRMSIIIPAIVELTAISMCILSFFVMENEED